MVNNVSVSLGKVRAELVCALNVAPKTWSESKEVSNSFQLLDAGRESALHVALHAASVTVKLAEQRVQEAIANTENVKQIIDMIEAVRIVKSRVTPLFKFCCSTHSV